MPRNARCSCRFCKEYLKNTDRAFEKRIICDKIKELGKFPSKTGMRKLER
jgi:hypothetical protein